MSAFSESYSASLSASACSTSFRLNTDFTANKARIAKVPARIRVSLIVNHVSTPKPT